MEQIIAALITGIVTLIVALLAVRPGLKSLENALDRRADGLSSEHKDLKGFLGNGQLDLSRRQDAFHKELEALSETTKYLYDEELKKQGRCEMLKRQNLDPQSVVDVLLAQQQYIAELKAEVRTLKLQLSHFQNLGIDRDEEREP